MSSVQSLSKDEDYDFIGITLSAVCAIHCLLAPLLVFSMPILYVWLHHPLFHAVVALLVIPVAVVAFYRGYKKHQHRIMLIFAILGLGTILLGVLLPHKWTHQLGHDLLTIFGSFSLMTAHFLNRKFLHRKLR